MNRPKMREQLCFAIFIAIITLHQTANGQKFNLPDDLKPLKYLLEIQTEPHEAYPFYHGTVHITVRCDKETSVIILNASELIILEEDVSVSSADDHISQPPLSIERQDDEEIFEQYRIHMTNKLDTGKEYIIRIGFKKYLLEDFEEYKLENYLGGVDGTVKKWMTVTKFGPGEVRSVFPCFDQMNFKARFKIIHTHPAGVIGFSNAPLSTKPTNVVPPQENWVTDEYEETDLMSAFVMGIVLGDFKSKKLILPMMEVSVQVWSNEVYLDELEFATEMVRGSFMFYNRYFDIKYPLSKLDILALPKYHNEDKIKYGLITIGENTLRLTKYTEATKMLVIAKKLCHAMGHQWIGAQVTMSTYSEYWLHEGLVAFLERLCVEESLDEFKSDFFSLRDVTTFVDILMKDVDMRLPSVLDSEFGKSDLTITLGLQKAYHLVRMINLIVGPKLFKNSIRKYLIDFTGKISTLDDVWQIFTKKAEEENVLDENIDISKVMRSWIKKRGYPVINVVRNYERKILSVTQEPFIMNGAKEEDTSTEECWIVPLGFATKKDEKIDNKIRHWLSCQEMQISTENIDADDWVLLNLSLNVISRTNYDEQNWISLQKTLLDQNEFIKIDTLTRVHLMSDMLQLANAGRLSYPIVFDTLKYLKNEEDYSVWFVVLEELDTISSNLFRTKFYDAFKKYVRDILTQVFAKKQFSKIETISPAHLIGSFEKIIIDAACSFGVENCINQCTKLFAKVFVNIDSEENNTIPIGIRDIVLCQAVERSSDQYVWNILFEKYSRYRSSVFTNKEILEALGCSKNSDILRTYLKKSIIPGKLFKEDSLIIFGSLAFNSVGYPVMKEFLIERYEEIEKFHAGSSNTNIDLYFIKLLETTTRREDLEELKNFKNLIQNHLINPEKIEESINQVTRNLEWYERNEAIFSQYFLTSN